MPVLKQYQQESPPCPYDKEVLKRAAFDDAVRPKLLCSHPKSDDGHKTAVDMRIALISYFIFLYSFASDGHISAPSFFSQQSLSSFLRSD
jgi:hypothetical protein